MTDDQPKHSFNSCGIYANKLIAKPKLFFTPSQNAERTNLCPPIQTMCVTKPFSRPEI